MFLAVEPFDMRGSFRSLAGAARRLGLEPTDGHFYVFLSKRRNIAKILFFDLSGWVVYMCREIAAVMRLPPVGTYPALVRAVQAAVERRSADDGVRTVLILDEAHEMRPDVLGMLRVLTNFAMDSRLVLSVLLIGQPPLARLLKLPELEDLAQRLAWYGTLRPLTREELRAYVIHRCKIAGAAATTFDDRAMEAMFEMGKGNPRATDHLARRSMEAAHNAGADRVGSTHVVTARASLAP